MLAPGYWSANKLLKSLDQLRWLAEFSGKEEVSGLTTPGRPPFELDLKFLNPF
jgi:hypothetical protein